MNSKSAEFTEDIKCVQETAQCRKNVMATEDKDELVKRNGNKKSITND